MKKTKILTCTAVTALLIISLMAHSASAATTSNFTLSSSGVRLPIMLPNGTAFNGSISTTGTVRFWVSDPEGAQIVNLGLIDKDATFGFVAQQTGNYTFNFENDLPPSIQVAFSYVTNPDISGGSSTGTPAVYLLIPVVITVVGCVLIIFFVRNKNKKRVNG
jgi:hypothetical protein